MFWGILAAFVGAWVTWIAFWIVASILNFEVAFLLLVLFFGFLLVQICKR